MHLWRGGERSNGDTHIILVKMLVTHTARSQSSSQLRVFLSTWDRTSDSHHTRSDCFINMVSSYMFRCSLNKQDVVSNVQGHVLNCKIVEKSLSTY